MFQGRTFIFDKEMTKLLTTCYPLDEKDAAKGKGCRQHRGQILSPLVGDIVDYGIAMMRDRNVTSIKLVLYRTTKGKNT